VLITRPAHQALALAQKVEAAGGRVVLWPTLAIRPTGDPAVREQLGARLAAAHLVIFISPNAVEHAVAAVPATTWRRGAALAAVGEGTARALRERLGRGPDLCPPTRFDSEGLLALPELQEVTGRRIVIVRGEGGRELLAETLRGRGAMVDYAEVYRRACPDASPAEAQAALAEGRVDVVVATSSEGLRNLLHLAGELAARLRALPLVVVSERMAREADALGFCSPARVAHGASDEALVEALLAWARGREK
jgi:uroporphyrinogen-III synthase